MKPIERRSRIEVAKEVVAITGTLITTTVVVGSLVHDFVCSEEHPCWICRKINARREKKLQATRTQEQDAPNAVPQPESPSVHKVSGKVKITAVDAERELNSVHEIEE